MSELVTKLKILEEDTNIFDTDMEYIIPLYQRAFAWTDKHLIQLIEDVTDVADNANYYIGSLIVSKQDNRYEVVDGQQRLTSLFLLLNCLGLNVKKTLTFACREKSNYTLNNIQELLEDNRSKLDMERIEPGILRGIRIINEEIHRAGFDREEFLEKLSRVVLYRIEVPENTDLNRYFEIMNTRGEQLEQHDILKAKLMNCLEDYGDKQTFARIWDACSDMTGYVQMHFVSSNNYIREEIFGWEWNAIPHNNWRKYRSLFSEYDASNDGLCIQEIIDSNFRVNSDDGYIDDDVRVRFESVIEFPHFLIHTLKVLIELKGIYHRNTGEKIIDELIDDKKLLSSFDRVLTYGVFDGGRVAEDEESFVKDYAMCLLRTRYIFDKYIIKREYANDSPDGAWSLKNLHVSGRAPNKKPYYKNTKCAASGSWYNTQAAKNRENIMMQSALRVSYTSPKVMHWITELLIWLSKNGCRNVKKNIEGYLNQAEHIAQEAVIENFFDECPDGIYAMGVNTPHIVFNYLDYLIWKNDTNHRKYGDFVFEFRNSVEHWYPRHPSEGTFEEWTDGVDQFGNLCIIQRNVNSKFSNMSPEAKKSTFKEMISKGSLKLRKMSDLTEKEGNTAASAHWKETAYREHEEEMIWLLKEACAID